MQGDSPIQSGERDFLVQTLVIDSIEKMQANHLSLWLHGILERGFVGFANMSEEALRRECARRGLRLEEQLEEPPLEEFDDDPEEDDEDLVELLSDACLRGEPAFS